MAARSDRFQFYRSGHLAGVTLLDAAITDFRYKRHTHDDYSLAVTREGYQNFFCAGRYYRVPRGGVIQINPDTLHDGFAEDSTGFQYSIIYLPRDQVREVVQGLGHSTTRELRFLDTVIDHPGLRRRLLEVMHAIKTLGREAIDVQTRFTALIASLCQMNGLTAAEARQRSPRDTLVIRARDYLHDHLHDPVSLDAMAAALNVSKFHLARLFKSQMGITPYRYLLDCRVNAARRALERQEDVDEVIGRFGFYDLSHLNRRFKEVYGTTPSAFRRQVTART